MERLDIDVSHEEIATLINEVDNNGDGEVDYQETLDHFEHLARSYSHGKQRVSVLLSNHAPPPGDSNIEDSPNLSPDDINILMKTLQCVGVSIRQSTSECGAFLSLPAMDVSLRDAVWAQFIQNASNESMLRTNIIEYFTKKDPSSVRYCEELPWHLKKQQDWKELKKQMVDLRVVDVMFGARELKTELFDYLCLLSIGNHVRFDMVKEYNRALEKWSEHGPSSSKTSLMTQFLGKVLAWYSSKIADHIDLPTLLRHKLDDSLLADVGVEFGNHTVALNNARSGKRLDARCPQSDYYVARWLWIQVRLFSLQPQRQQML